MRTRTLLLLSLGCAFAIMVAGAVFLVQLAGQDEPDPPVELGETVRVGDMSVAVVASQETAGRLDVSVSIGGVVDPDGADGFRLIASGRRAERVDLRTGGCGATTTTRSTCIVAFDVADADGVSRVLFYERGEDRARWVLG